jgi:predicted RND superfamily exporter protein
MSHLSGTALKLHKLVIGSFSSLANYSIARPKHVLLVVSLVTLAIAPGIARTKLRTDGQALVSPNAPEVIYDNQIRQKFGIEDDLVVLIRSKHPDGIFNSETLRLVRDLTAEFKKMAGINPSNVMSLATEPSFRMRPGTLIHQNLLEPPLKTKEELELFRDDLRRIQLYSGTLVSADGAATVILVGIPQGADRTRLYQSALDILAAKEPRPEALSVTGAPVAESLLGIHILEDLGVPKIFLGTSTRGLAAEQIKPLQSFYEFRRWIARRLGLVPVAALVMMLIFFLSFRNVLATLLPLPGIVATMLFVFGVMGWVGVPVYLTIAVMPVLLVATGVTNDIYVFSRYFALLREQPDAKHLEVVRETFARMASPIASTSLTTGIGFLSFGVSPLGPVRAFGICTGIGILFGLFYSFTVVPAMLALINPAILLPTKTRARAPTRLSTWFGDLGGRVIRFRRWVAVAVLLTTVLTPLGLRHLVVQDSWTDAFDPESEFRRATKYVNQQFFGMHLLFVSVDLPKVLAGDVPASAISADQILLPVDLVKNPAEIAGSPLRIWSNVGSVEKPISSPGPSVAMPVRETHIEMTSVQGDKIIARLARSGSASNAADLILTSIRPVHFELAARSQVRPDIIRAIGELGSFIRQKSKYAVGGVLGPADYIATTRFMARPNDPEARVVPSEAGEVKLMWDYYGLARGPQRLHQIVDTNFWQSLTTVFLKDANFVATAQLMKEIRSYEQEHLTPLGIKIGFAGDVALSQSLIHGIVTTQLQSLLWSLLGIYFITALLGGSLRWGTYCVLPSALAVLLKLAIMGWFGIPLGVATSMFAAMTLGIGVNCSIQLLEGFSQARTGASLPAALSRALSLTGPPALINTLAVSLGFGVLMLSQVPANARLGLLVVLGLVECFIVSLLLLPVLLHWFPLRGPQPTTPPIDCDCSSSPISSKAP